MSEQAPTNIQGRLEAMQTAITAEEQVNKDAEREKAWLGFNSEGKTALGPRQAKTVENVADYLQSRPENEAEAATVQAAKNANEAVGQYEPTSDMDKELAYLTHEFSILENVEDAAAALDLLSDFCESHGLTRAQEKTLRGSLLLENIEAASEEESLKSEEMAEEPVAAVKPNEDVAQQASDPLESSLTAYGMAEAKPAEAKTSSPTPESAKETPVFSKGDEVVFIKNDGVIRQGTVSSLEEDNKPGNEGRILYVIDYVVDGEMAQIVAHKEDLKKVDAEGKTVDDAEVVEAEAAEAEESNEASEPSEDVIEGEVVEPAEEPASEETPEEDSVEPTTDTEEKTPWEKAKALPLAASVAVSQYLNAQKEKWNALPPEKKKRYKIIGGIATAAVVLTAAYFVAKGFDSGVDANTGAEAGGTGTGAENSGGVNAGDANTGGGPDAGPSISEAAQTVEKGEGWFQTFEEMGIKSTADQKALLNEIGPKLVRMGAAYSAPELGGFGISSSGELPTDAIKLIQSVGEARGYIS